MSSLASKSGPRYRHTAGEEEPYETLAVEKLTPIIGAEISGVDPAKLVSDERSNRQMDEIHRALAENRRSRRSSISPSAGNSANYMCIRQRPARARTLPVSAPPPSNRSSRSRVAARY